MVKDELVYYVTPDNKLQNGSLEYAIIRNTNLIMDIPTNNVFETESEAKEYLKCQIKKQILELERKLQELREV